MKRIKNTYLAALAVLLSPMAANADMLPIPDFERTFSSSSLTRGFWFQAPVDFIIDGLQVPDETNHGLQNVEVFLLPGVPPEYPGSTAGTSLFRAIGVSSATLIATNIAISAGSYIGILGAAGDSGIMHNSYGPNGPFASNILGNAVTLTRFLTQTNLVSGAGGVSSEESFNVGRIMVSYRAAAVPEPGTLALLGLGLAGIGFGRRKKV